MRHMSFSLTADAMRERRKTVTRRYGWLFLQEGDLLLPVERTMGLRRGEHQVPLGPPIRVVSVGLVRDYYIEHSELVKEGCEHMEPEEFIAMLNRLRPKVRGPQWVNRIEFEHTEEVRP